MRWKTTLALLLATVGIGAYISLYEIKQPTRSERRREAKHVLDIDPAAVSAIILNLPEAKTTLIRTGDAWTMQPSGLRGNGALTAQLLNHVSPLRAERVLAGTPDKPLDLASFGLEPPSSSITLTVNGRPVTLLIGEKTAVGGNRYMKDADRPEVFIVPEAIFTIINQPFEYYRDHHLVQLGGQAAQSLAVTSAPSTFTLTRDGTVWRITAPFQDLADRKASDSLLNQIAGLQITRFVHDAPDAAQLVAAGLEKPFAQFAIAYGEPERQVTLTFGSALPDDPALIHAKRSDEPALYAVAKEAVEGLLLPPDELRSKPVFQFFTGNVTKISVKRGDNDWTIERVKNQWQEPSGRALESVRVELWLAQLADARFERVVTDGTVLPAAGDAAREWVSVWTADQPEPQRLLLDATADKAVGGIYAVIESRALRVVLPEQFTDLLALPDEGAGAEHPLDDGAVDEQVQRDQGPPEQVPPPGAPGQQSGR